MAQSAAVKSSRAPAPDSRPLTAREDQLARNHAAVIERLQREGIPIPPPPA